MELQECYSKISISVSAREVREPSVAEWEQEWASSTNGNATKSFFQSVKQRLKMKITVSTNLATIITGYGKLKSFYRRFKIVDSRLCSCGEEQTMDHVLFKCDKHRTERDKLKDTSQKKTIMVKLQT